MEGNKCYSQAITVFHGRIPPEPGILVGYGALIEKLELPVPVPLQLAIISEKHRQYSVDGWLVLTPRHQPEESLYDQLVFALKYEGCNLLFFKKLFEKLDPADIQNVVQKEPFGQYSRKIWFLYEWLMQELIPIPDLKEGNYEVLLDEKLQFASSVNVNSRRHRIRNNLPGTVGFCPLIHKTDSLNSYIAKNLAEKAQVDIAGFHKDILIRTSAFLMLKDSRASFTIEGENPSQNRAIQWGKCIGEAGKRSLSKEEFLRLQQIIIGNSRFLTMGYRKEGGFVGEFDRISGEPIPEHISARWQDLDVLMTGLADTAKMMESIRYNPVLAAASIAFGFVFIHPLVDGNGRLHRYLIHHLLTAMRFAPQGMVFPVSAAILERMDDYRKVLESYSYPLLPLIKWKTTAGNNVEVLNETIDYYRYFDATEQTEFLFGCIEETITSVIPQEAQYLQNYDEMKIWLDNRFQMPDHLVALLLRFLDQNQGVLSKRARTKEFAILTDEEVNDIEAKYKILFTE
ncbi:MAG: cell filamentation protein Fic [Bacteroidetes bacterium GWF2_49_14]|nr:MAG: cell filamentation protein Fic [Bacteroidetes bacterium GWF2_49_14]HBB93082.1 cell filamentation protein Fic [Bacteroidales bacterium]